MTDYHDYMNTHKLYPDDISRRIDIPPGFDSFRDTATDGKPHPDNALPTVKESLTTVLDENGLARCGCGGRAESMDNLDAYGNYSTCCHDCGTYAWDHRSQAEADKAWNTAMGWRADE